MLTITIAVAVPGHWCLVQFLLWAIYNKKAIKTFRSVLNAKAPLKKYTAFPSSVDIKTPANIIYLPASSYEIL